MGLTGSRSSGNSASVRSATEKCDFMAGAFREVLRNPHCAEATPATNPGAS